MGEEVLTWTDAGIEAGAGASNDFRGVEHAEAGGGAEGEHGCDRGPLGAEENQCQWEGDALFFGQECGEEPGDGGPVFLAGPGIEGSEAE